MSKGCGAPPVRQTATYTPPFEVRVCEAIKCFCPVLDDITCKKRGSQITLYAYDTTGARKKLCSFTDGMSRCEVESLLENAMAPYLNQVEIEALISSAKVGVSFENGTLTIGSASYPMGAVTDDGNTITITDSLNNSVSICSDPVCAITDNGDGTWTTVGKDTVVISTGTITDNGDGSKTINLPGGGSVVAWEEPVLTVTGSLVDNTDPQNPIINMPDAAATTSLAGTAVYGYDEPTKTYTVNRLSPGEVCNIVQSDCDVVLSVTGSIVDNTDPKNPVITAPDDATPIKLTGTAVADYDAAGQSYTVNTLTSGEVCNIVTTSCDVVLEVTGDMVDNADPKRPVITAPEKSAQTVVDGNAVDNYDPETQAYTVNRLTITDHDTSDGLVTIASVDGSESVDLCTDPVKGSRLDGASGSWMLVTQSGALIPMPLHNADGAPVNATQVQPSLINGATGGRLSADSCVMPYERKVCGTMSSPSPFVNVGQMQVTRTGEHTFVYKSDFGVTSELTIWITDPDSDAFFQQINTNGTAPNYNGGPGLDISEILYAFNTTVVERTTDTGCKGRVRIWHRISDLDGNQTADPRIYSAVTPDNDDISAEGAYSYDAATNTYTAVDADDGSANSNLAVQNASAYTGGTVFSGKLYLSSSDFISFYSAALYYPAVDVYLDCDGNVIRAIDEYGNAVDPADVDYTA